MKRMTSYAALAALCLTGVSACVTPEPCTAEWVEWRTDKVLTRFARANSSTVNALRDLSGNIEEPGPLLAMRIAMVVGDLDDLTEDFNRIVLPELNSAIAQCSQPREFVPAFTQFLRKEGVGEDVIQWVEVLGYMAVEQNRF